MRVGEKVVYIQKTLPELGLIKGSVYTIHDVAECNCDTGPHFDVGVPKPVLYTICPDCGAILNMDDRWFISHQGFRPIDEASIEETIEELLTRPHEG